MTKQTHYDGEWMSLEERDRRRAERDYNPKHADFGFPMVIADRVEYKSTLTGEMITGRRQHREHLAQHGCVELGNERPKPVMPAVLSRAERAADIKLAIEQVKAGYIPPETPIGGVDENGIIIEKPDLEPIVLSGNIQNGDIVRSSTTESPLII